MGPEAANVTRIAKQVLLLCLESSKSAEEKQALVSVGEWRVER